MKIHSHKDDFKSSLNEVSKLSADEVAKTKIDSFVKEFMQDKLNEFLEMTPEEKHEIDNDPRYDGLFTTIQEISDVVESALPEESND